MACEVACAARLPLGEEVVDRPEVALLGGVQQRQVDGTLRLCRREQWAHAHTRVACSKRRGVRTGWRGVQRVAWRWV
eukprot:3383836-Prymnesium_polylepis.1